MHGTRLYSIKEIKEMSISKNIPDDFKAYISSAPQSAGKILKQWFEMEEQKSDSYDSLEFENRLEVDSLLIHIANDDFCPVHGTPLDKIQVVVKYDQHKRFGIITQCCKACKRIYCSQAEIKEIKDAIADKNVSCEVFEQ